MALTGAHRISRMEDRCATLIQEVADLEIEQGADLPLGGINTAVADIANMNGGQIATVFEALRLKPEWCYALARMTVDPVSCKDPEAARIYKTYPLNEARRIRKEQRAQNA